MAAYTLQDMEVLQKRLRRLLGDVTFLEAFNRSGGCSTVTAHRSLCTCSATCSSARSSHQSSLLNMPSGRTAGSVAACQSDVGQLAKPEVSQLLPCLSKGWLAPLAGFICSDAGSCLLQVLRGVRTLLHMQVAC